MTKYLFPHLRHYQKYLHFYLMLIDSLGPIYNIMIYITSVLYVMCIYMYKAYYRKRNGIHNINICSEYKYMRKGKGS